MLIQGGSIPLLFACSHGEVPLVRLLLLDVKDSDERTECIHSAMRLAARQGRIEILRFLIHEHRPLVNAPSKKGLTPFALAVRDGNVEIVVTLLTLRRDIRLDAMQNASSILYIVYNQGFLSDVPWLPFVDLNQKYEGLSIMELASSHGQDQIMSLLRQETILMSMSS